MSSPNQTHRLAAIVFVDIVRYPALMQHDEAVARLLLQKFLEQLYTELEDFQGQIVNFYRKGCLCILDSSVDAVRCAAQLQEIF